MIAGVIISLLAELFLPYVDIILYVLLALAALFLIFFIYKVVKKSKQIAREDGENRQM